MALIRGCDGMRHLIRHPAMLWVWVVVLWL